MTNLIKLSSIALLVLLMFSCKKTENNYYCVERITVNLHSKDMIKTVVKPMASSKKMSARSTSTDYEHKFPSSYKAYLICKESMGEYTKGELVDIIDVSEGDNTITIPKLNYDIIITNYDNDIQNHKWYTWDNAIDQLPKTSHEVYLYGKNNIDYSTVTEGTVELTNPYAAVMIKDNQWVNGYPRSYDGNQDYLKVSGWYVLYIRNNNTNTMIPISIAGNPNTTYTLSNSIEANNIYQFTIDGSVSNLEEGNLGVIVKPFEKIIKKTIKL